MATVSIIAAVNCIPLRLPFNHWADPPLFAGKPRTTLDSVLVRVALANGLVGWGEAYGGEIAAVSALMQSRIAPLACGEDASDPTLTARLERTLHNLGRLDTQQAFAYLSKAAEHGHGPAQVELGFVYFNGKGTLPKSLPLAFRWTFELRLNGSRWQQRPAIRRPSTRWGVHTKEGTGSSRILTWHGPG